MAQRLFFIMMKCRLNYWDEAETVSVLVTCALTASTVLKSPKCLKFLLEALRT
jgi:hypothetical protein